MLTEPARPDGSVNDETCLPLLQNAQNYLQARLSDDVADVSLSAAWTEFFRLYDDLIRRFAVAQGVARSDVDDCAQEVWSEVAKRLVQFDRPAGRPGLRSWLYTVVRSKATDAFRKQARHPTRALDDQLRDEVDDPGNDPVEHFEQQWERAVVQSALAQLQTELSPINVRILRMRLIEMRSVDWVATELNLAKSQVYARQHRILQKVRSRVRLITGNSPGAP